MKFTQKQINAIMQKLKDYKIALIDMGTVVMYPEEVSEEYFIEKLEEALTEVEK